MQAPTPREQTQLTSRELDTFEAMTSVFEYNEEHLLDPSLVLYVTR
ncbi:hypothetical protein [Corynebacterium sp. UBA2622]|nr:hypothetical protein [Corynebacterium sp. UBA2622]